MSSQGSPGDSRWGVHSYNFTAGPHHDSSTAQAPPYVPMRTSRNNKAGLGNVSSYNSTSQMASGLISLPTASALSHPRIVPNTSSHLNYSTSLVSYPAYGMNGLMLSPPLGTSSIPISRAPTTSTSEMDPYQVPPLSNTTSSNSPNRSRPATGSSPGSRRGSTNDSAKSPTPNKKRKTEGKSPSFLVKLYELLKDPKYQDLLTWDETGQFIVAHTAHPRLLELLQSAYSQKRIASFTRQLNIYGWMRDNITRNTESTEPTLWRHESLNRDSTLDDLLTINRRVAPRTSQAEKRRKMEEEETFSSFHRSPMSSMNANTWPIPVGPVGGFSLGSSPVDNRGMGHHRQRNRRSSFPQGSLEDCDNIPRPLQDALQLHSLSQIQSPMGGGMMSYSAPSSTTTNDFFPLSTNRPTPTRVITETPQSDPGILGNSGIRWIAGQGGFLLQNGGSANGPKYQVDNPTSWACHGISTLGNGLKPFQPAPLDDNSPEFSIQQLTNGLQAFNMPQNTHTTSGPTIMRNVRVSPPISPIALDGGHSPSVAASAPISVAAPPTYHGSPEEPVILTPPPPPPPAPAPQHVVPGSYMGPNLTRTAQSWTPRLNPPSTSVTRAEVLAPRSSSLLQRVGHGQSGLPYVEEETDPLPSASLPQPRLFDDFDE